MWHFAESIAEGPGSMEEELSENGNFFAKKIKGKLGKENAYRYCGRGE